MSETSLPQRHLSPEYEARLRQDFDDQTVATLVYERQYAPHSHNKGERVPYVRLNADNGSRPVLYVPGFTEGTAAKAAFGAELARRGFDVILPDQNRKKLVEDAATSKRSATYSQATNALCVLESEGIQECDVITHSYGSLVLDAMTRIAVARGNNMFAESHVAMLTPAGFSRERLPRLLGRLFASMASEVSNPKKFDAPDMLRAGIANVVANVPWALREGIELSRLRVDYPRLLAGRVASLAVVTYAADRLYPDKVLNNDLSQAVQLGATWVVPVGPAEYTREEDITYGKPNATHNDEQFNPYRVAGPIQRLLRP